MARYFCPILPVGAFAEHTFVTEVSLFLPISTMLFPNRDFVLLDSEPEQSAKRAPGLPDRMPN
jgi:hypothetical protein